MEARSAKLSRMILDKLARGIALAAVLSALAASVTGCGSGSGPASSAAQDAKLQVVCTISTLCSLVQSVGGAEIATTTLVPVGGSPETYEPTPGDMEAVSRARVLIKNGNGLELWLDKLLASASGADMRRVVLAASIPPAERAT